MEYQRIASTDLMISRIGFGCWAIGDHGYGNIEDSESIRAIRKALDCGINFFDTADVYGFGHSEKILGKALGPQRNKVVVATKFGLAWNENGKTFKDCSPKRIVEALEESLKRLKIDCIPIYQIHWHDGKTPIEDVMDALLKCRDAGKILHIGCCNFSKELLSEACNKHEVVSCQYLYNLTKRQNENIIKYSSEELGLSVLVYSVLGRGVFSGKYDVDSHFGTSDTRAKDNDFKGTRYHKNILIAKKLREIGRKYGKSAAKVAICWVLDNPHITCVITGIKNESQASENAQSTGWFLDQDDMKMINLIISENRF